VLLGLAVFACDGSDDDGGPGPTTTVSDQVCERIVGGPAGSGDPVASFAQAHFAVRVFGAHGLPYSEVDARLASLLADGVPSPPDLVGYAAQFPEVACVVDAGAGALGPATVTMEGDVAIVKPGTGAVSIPAAATAVAIDLRDLPATPDLEAALVAAVGAAVATPVERASRMVLRHEGLVDPFFSETNVYDATRVEMEREPIAGTGTDRPLAVLTSVRMAPVAAEIAGTLRTDGRAWLYGRDVIAQVAESSWSPVDERGLAWRSADLESVVNGRWPDVIEADVATDDPIAQLADLATRGQPEPYDEGSLARPELTAPDPFQDYGTAELGVGELRAGLLVAHGAARWFFPYFADVGDVIDERLAEVLPQVEDAVADRRAADDLVGRFGNALSDGHMFVFDTAPGDVTCWPVRFEDVDERPVVRFTSTPDVAPGDEVLELDGQPIDDWVAERISVGGGATPGYARNIAFRGLSTFDGPRTFLVRSPDGTERPVIATPGDCETLDDLPFAPTVRPSGFLDDLGAGDLYYLNLAGEVTTESSQVTTAFTDAQSAAGMVVDMRGYPGVDHYQVAERLYDASFQSAIFRVPVYTGPAIVTTDESQYDLSPLSPGFTGPVALLVGPATVSAAENFSMMLDGRVTVVGRTSAGTNGNITGVILPGGFVMTFTGMEVLFPDGRPFHGIGMVPDVDAAPTVQSVADGSDPELEAAIAALHGS